MKELSGEAAATVGAPATRCIELLAAVDRYPEWYPDVIRSAEVLERDRAGAPTRAAADVHVAVGPVSRSFALLLDVEVKRDGVRLERVSSEPSDEEEFEVLWHVRSRRPTELHVTLRARLEVPRFLPIGDVGETVAQGFVEAARRVLEDSRPNASASSS